MPSLSPRLAARAIIVHQARLLLVNAYPESHGIDLWCAPGGGVERGTSLPDNLAREVHEETGLRITVGAPCLVNEFHDPDSHFHQVDVYFRCSVAQADLPPGWRDPEGVVTRRRWVTAQDIASLRIKPDSLADVAFRTGQAISYDPLEPIVR